MRLIRNAIDDKVDELGMLITFEMGKIATEGRGEVVEFIDVADYAVGLSRSIGGTVVPSERKKHFMTEVCHPLGVIGVISAFNFPIAVSNIADVSKSELLLIIRLPPYPFLRFSVGTSPSR